VAIVAAASFVRAAGDRAGATAAWVAALMAVCPLFWLSGLRPMSDVPGLAAVLVSLALTARGLDHRRRLPWGAFVAGLAAGVRSQTVWLTMPLLLVAVVVQRRAGAWWLLSRPGAALAAGGLAWAVPLLAASGGVDGYLRALRTQAELDFAGVDMLWLNPTPRRLALSLYETFVLPWASVPLAAAIAVAAAAGAVAMLLRERRPLLIALVAFAPYLVFHLLFQETLFVRYGLPVVPLVAWFAVRGIALAGRAMPLVAVPVAGAALLVAVPGQLLYGGHVHPAFRAIGDAVRRAEAAPPAATFAHYSLWRPLQTADAAALHAVPPRNNFEWLGAVDYWRGGGRRPIWFFADPRRTDLALIDPHAREDVVRYDWPVADRPELGGTRPAGVDWYRLPVPGWFAGEGWSLTPETGGQTRATAAGPDRQPIRAWLRRRDAPMHLMIGTRHLGAAGDPAADVEVAIDGRIVDRWTTTVQEPNVLRFLDLPDGLRGDGDFATLTVSSRPAAGSLRGAEVAVRQFDAQEATRLIVGFGEGWHELESERGAGRTWRWSSGRSVLRLHGPARAVRLTLRGESPLRYFDAPPTVSVRAGDRIVAQFRPADDFEWSATIDAEAIANARGAITLAQDRVYHPGAAEGTSDARELGLRLFDVRIAPVSP
jgi:hypothetical protein